MEAPRKIQETSGRLEASAGLIPGAQPFLRFDGPEYIPARDQKRLTGQAERIFNLMADGKWRSLPEIARETGDPEASVSAQLRNLRKERFGSHTVNRRHIYSGLFEYQLIPAKGR